MTTHLDLFSGIGGFALAAQWNGLTTIGFSEIEPYACKVLKRHWPNVPNHGDIRNVRGIAADLVTGGFPCQPFSFAGKRGGAKDDRHLWPEMCRVIDEARPAWVLGENVPGIIGMELDNVLSDLEHIGYACWPVVVPACAVDARHRRDRVWIVAHADTTGRRELRRTLPTGTQHTAAECCGEDVAHAEGSIPRQPAEWVGREGAGGGSADCRGVASSRGETLSHAERTGLEGQAWTGNDRTWRQTVEPACGCNLTGVVVRGGIRGDCWQAEPPVGRVVDGLPNRAHRLRGLGNAIVPQVAARLIGMMIKTSKPSPQS